MSSNGELQASWQFAFLKPWLVSRLVYVRRRFGRATDRIAHAADPITKSCPYTMAASVLIGIVPVLMCALIQSSAHQVISAILLAPLVWSCVVRGRTMLGIGLLTTTFVCHSATMIQITRTSPDIGASLAIDGADYWHKQRTWIETGSDPEYHWQAWVPAHAQLLLGTTIYSMTSFGLITLEQGFYEVDLMNYYNGRLILASRDPWIALRYGWHIWSILRGCGYVILTFELTSLGLQFAIGRSLASWQSRAWRWLSGTGFLMLDATTKWFLLEIVRQQLSANLL